MTSFKSYLKINLSDEEKLLISIILNKKKLNKDAFRLINYELLVKITSSHLMLPSLYVNLLRNKNLKYIPKDLKKYLEEIYLINEGRNKILLKEINEISLFLSSRKVNHVFVKGSALLTGGFYFKIGERMIGDIDILISKNHKQKTIKAFEENKYGFQNQKGLSLNKHLPRLINKNKMFAVEIHEELIHSKKKYFNYKEILNSKLRTSNGNYILEHEKLAMHTIHNFQINDLGNLKAIYSYRSFYDYLQICLNQKRSKFFTSKNSHVINFILILEILTGLKIRKANSIKNELFRLRFLLKKRYNIYNKIDHFLTVFVYEKYIFFKKIKAFIKHKNYRSYVISKLTKS